jgi:hypothetical protein
LTSFASSFGLSITLVESLDATSRINELLRPREKRMALGTDLHADQFLGCTGLNHIPAGARDGGCFVSGMDIGFHYIFLLLKKIASSLRSSQ